MEYKKKIKSKQEGITGEDEAFGKLMMRVNYKKGMPIFLCIIMLILILTMWFAYATDTMPFPFAAVASLIFLGIGFVEASFMFDHIRVYEYGMVTYSWLTLMKKRIAYDDITTIVSRKMSRKQQKVSLWKFTIQNKKRGISLDATAYHNLNDFINALAHEAKINILR